MNLKDRVTVKNATLASDDGLLSPSSHSVTFNGVIDRELKTEKKWHSNRSGKLS